MRKALAAAVITLGLLALLGAGKGGTYQGGSYGDAGSTYAAGMVQSGWDTVVVLFTAQALVDASPDTFGLPASATSADIARIVELNSIRLGRDGTKYSFRDGPSDTAHVYRLGTGKDVPTFAWTILDESDTDGYYGSQFQYIRSAARQSVNGGEGTGAFYALKQTIGNGASNRQAPMFYIPYEDYIPPGASIVSATANFAALGAMYWSYSDSMVSVALNNPADAFWYTVKGGTGLNALTPNYAKASWTYQTDTNASGTSWGGSQAHPWTPTLADRAYYWGMGTWSDWSSTTLSSGGFIAAGVNIPVGLTNNVQRAVMGETNNGTMLLWETNNAVTAQTLLYGWDNYSSAINRNPYVVVKYVTKKFVPRFGTSDLAMVLTTDDFERNVNSAFTDTFLAHGGRYTMFGARVHVDHPAGNQVGMDSLLTWLWQGFEIGTHSWYHKNPAGLTYWEQSRPGKVFDATAYAQVYADAKPDWLYALADSAVGDSLKTNPLFGKSMALPNNTYSYGVLRVLSALGYEGVRCNATNVYDRTKYYTLPTWAPAYGDTAISATPDPMQRRPRNMMLVPYAMSASIIVGDTTQHSVTMEEVRHNMRRLAYQWRGQGRGEMVFLTHDLKSGPGKTGWYVDGIDADEMGAMLDVVDEVGARYMTVSELVRLRKDSGLGIDTPTGYYNAPADDDSARFYAASKIWVTPNGVDTKFLRNIR